MAKTLLNAVNETLKRVRIISGDSSALSTLVDPARQNYVDTAVQAINEALEELYSTSGLPMPEELSSDTIILATNVRSYGLPTNMVQMHWPLIDRTNTQYIYEYPGTYLDLLKIDPEQDDLGQPMFAAINPEDGELYLDRAPTSTYNGRVYTFQYDKDISLSSANDRVPFSDAVFRAMVPVWAELWKRDQRQSFDGDFVGLQIGRASRLVTQQQQRRSWRNR